MWIIVYSKEQDGMEKKVMKIETWWKSGVTRRRNRDYLWECIGERWECDGEIAWNNHKTQIMILSWSFGTDLLLVQFKFAIGLNWYTVESVKSKHKVKWVEQQVHRAIMCVYSSLHGSTLNIFLRSAVSLRMQFFISIRGTRKSEQEDGQIIQTHHTSIDNIIHHPFQQSNPKNVQLMRLSYDKQLCTHTQ